MALAVLTMLALAIPAGAQVPGNKGVRGRPNVMDAVRTFDYSPNMKPMGFSPRLTFPENTERANSFNSDLAFWGNLAVQGSYAGFRLIDISSPANPKEIINWEECASPLSSTGNQGDVIIWENLIFRSWNSPTPASGAMCGNWQMNPGEEGVHVIDISDPTNPRVIAFVDTPCGSHTETLVPDLQNNRLLIYSNPSSNAVLGGDPGGEQPVSCRGIDIIEVPLDNPAAASYLRFLPAGNPAEDPAMHHPCHDTAVILGNVNLVACAGGSGTNVFSIGAPGGGTPENPLWLYHTATGGIGGGHSAAFTHDGEILVIGHEPGGGSAARCQSGPPPRSEQEYSYFFLDARTGELLGQFAFPRSQTPQENCTVHNYNIVPTDKGYILVAGNYQSGISVVDFTDPANAVEIAYADPAPLTSTGILLGGDWSTYWYNGFIYESDIRRGLFVWKLNDPAVAGARHLPYLNPQTTDVTFDLNVRGQSRNRRPLR